MKKYFFFNFVAILGLFASPSCNQEGKAKIGSSNNVVASEKQIAEEVAKMQRNPVDIPLGVVVETQSICCGSPVPTGWIKVNDSWSPTSCGNPTRIVYNICVIEQYDNKPVGSFMSVCSGETTPDGWADVKTMWVPTCCGHPTLNIMNMKYIKRIS